MVEIEEKDEPVEGKAGYEELNNNTNPTQWESGYLQFNRV